MMQAGTPRSFNPRTPCGVRPVSATTKELNQIVSIHALLAECDSGSIVAVRCIPGFNPRTPCGVRQGRAARRVNRNVFQSTHSLRSATCQSAACPPPLPVSIHALLAECDPGVRPVKIRICSFNPRTPCGVRPYQFTGFTPTNKFQSTHSLRSATPLLRPSHHQGGVSIHALLAECDCARPYTLLLNRANHTLRQPP